jgi:PKD repeat protein
MKKMLKSGWVAVLLVTGLTAVKAQQTTYNTDYSAGDIFIGFTTKSGNDLIYDLGQVAAITNSSGRSWVLTSYLSGYNYASLNWGCIGNLINSGNPRTIFTTTSPGIIPGMVNGLTAFKEFNVAMATLSQTFTNAGTGTLYTSAGLYVFLPASSTIGWESETISGAGSSDDYANFYESPDVTGIGSADFSLVNNDGSNPVQIGFFTLSATGVLTYTNGPSAPVAAFTQSATSGNAPLTVTFGDASTGDPGTNWLWTFGNGSSFTNTVSSTAATTYASAGTYTVILKVSNAGGSTTATNHVVVTGSAVPAPVASFTGTPTNGFAPLTVVLTDTSTGTVTNRAWSFGDGHTYTNATSLYATNTYTTNGSFTVSLTATGPGGTNTSSVAKYVVISPAPSFGPTTVNGNLIVISGTNGPAGVPYRILTTTNLSNALVNWVPVATNTFTASGGFGYTNATTKAQSYFKLVSP